MGGVTYRTRQCSCPQGIPIPQCLTCVNYAPYVYGRRKRQAEKLE
ncbi:hypothetical protein TELCIR_04936 [Teladorsagia circumcincta]|uniref:Uncharacterized protein n=1 Tax=Teladorsagia circumcincta TaxID=45464 RepID=A0A2G9US98_TELCI|nr:hypothetical protein TELCIR_04936 [Teladorsagia circumcincta]